MCRPSAMLIPRLPRDTASVVSVSLTAWSRNRRCCCWSPFLRRSLVSLAHPLDVRSRGHYTRYAFVPGSGIADTSPRDLSFCPWIFSKRAGRRQLARERPQGHDYLRPVFRLLCSHFEEEKEGRRALARGFSRISSFLTG